MMVMKFVVFRNFTHRLALNLRQVRQFVRHFIYKLQIYIYLMASSSAVANKQFRRRMRCTIGQCRSCGMNHIDSVVHSKKRRIGRQAR